MENRTFANFHGDVDRHVLIGVAQLSSIDPRSAARIAAALLLASSLFLLGCPPPPARAGPESVGISVLKGRLFDAERGEVFADGVVVMAGSRFQCVGDVGDCQWPEGATVHDYGDATILPGLIDLHAHVRSHFLAAYVPAGITTIRDASNTVRMIRHARAQPGTPLIIATGAELDGPESFLAPISPGAGGPGGQSSEDTYPLLVSGEAEARRAVGELASAGMDWLKLREMLDPEDFGVLVEAGLERGMPATADLGLIVSGGLRGPRVDIVEAARMGLASIEHFSGLALAYQRRGGDPLARELDARILDEIAHELVVSGIHLVPTAAVLHMIATPGRFESADLPGSALLAPAFAEHWQRLEERTSLVGESIAADLRLWRAMLDRLRRTDLLIGAGSDAPNAPGLVPGVGLHQEMEALVVAGLSPLEALQAATWNAARILDRNELGRVSPGARADIVVVAGNPVEDIRATRRIVAVWQAGRRVDIDAAWRRLEADLAAHEGPIWHPAIR